MSQNFVSHRTKQMMLDFLCDQISDFCHCLFCIFNLCCYLM